MYIVLGGYLRILGVLSVQSCCTLSLRFAHIECYSDCSHRGIHLDEPLCYDVV